MSNQERDIETYFRHRIETAGGVAFKFVSPGNAGVPDRIVILPWGRVVFVELKQAKGRLSGMQKWQRERIRKRGGTVRTLWSKEQVDEFMQEMEGGGAR